MGSSSKNRRVLAVFIVVVAVLVSVGIGGYLTLRSFNGTDEDLVVVNSRHELRELPIKHSHVFVTDPTTTDSDLDGFLQGRHITHLELSGCTELSDSGIRVLGEHTELESLALLESSITEDGLAVISNLRNLRVFRFGSTHFGIGGTLLARATFLTELTLLDVLELSNCTLKQHAVDSIAKLPALEFLFLGNCEFLNSVDFGVLSGALNLRTIDLSGTNIDISGVEAFLSIGSIRQVTLFDPATITRDELQQLMARNPNVKWEVSDR